jgi:hypothetical protein
LISAANIYGGIAYETLMHQVGNITHNKSYEGEEN